MCINQFFFVFLYSLGTFEIWLHSRTCLVFNCCTQYYAQRKTKMIQLLNTDYSKTCNFFSTRPELKIYTLSFHINANSITSGVKSF